jgi:hypothetical protein
MSAAWRLDMDVENATFCGGSTSAGAADAIGRVLPEVKDSRQRIELAEALGVQVQTQKAATLLASFERIAGRSFGQIPMDPNILGNTHQMREAKKRFRARLDIWAQWWAWEPPKDP